MTAANQILSVDKLQITFAEKQFTAVNKISFSIDKGKTLALVGESGSGKSLTALAIMGLLPKPASMQGEVRLQIQNFHPAQQSFGAATDLRLATHDLRLLRGKDMGMIFQEPMTSLNPVMTVGKQLTEAIRAYQKVSYAAGKQMAIAWLDKVQLPLPEKIYNRYPHQLSGGQKQRVMIAMAMCNHPSLLIADEPTTALDVTVQQEILRLMQFLQQEHQSAMLFITHDLALAATIADSILVLYRGEAVEYGKTAQVLKHPQHPYTQALIACRPSPEKKGHRLGTVADFMTGEPKTTGRTDSPDRKPADDATLLAVDNLGIWFTQSKNVLGAAVSYFKAVDDVSFAIKKGEILGLVGESGCGKSTLARALVGLLPVQHGAIVFQERDIARIPLHEWRTVRKNIQMVFQDPYSSLNPRMTIGDMLTEPLLVHGVVPQREFVKEVNRLLDLVQLPGDAINRYPHQFSGGQRQRIGIARALALRPQLLICDESVSALDVSIQAQILNLLKDLQNEFQLTYLFISHDLSVVHYISDRVMVMQAGKIVETGTAAQVLGTPQSDYTRRLISAMPRMAM